MNAHALAVQVSGRAIYSLGTTTHPRRRLAYTSSSCPTAFAARAPIPCTFPDLPRQLCSGFIGPAIGCRRLSSAVLGRALVVRDLIRHSMLVIAKASTVRRGAMHVLSLRIIFYARPRVQCASGQRCSALFACAGRSFPCSVVEVSRCADSSTSVTFSPCFSMGLLLVLDSDAHSRTITQGPRLTGAVVHETLYGRLGRLGIRPAVRFAPTAYCIQPTRNVADAVLEYLVSGIA